MRKGGIDADTEYTEAEEAHGKVSQTRRCRSEQKKDTTIKTVSYGDKTDVNDTIFEPFYEPKFLKPLLNYSKLKSQNQSKKKKSFKNYTVLLNDSNAENFGNISRAGWTSRVRYAIAEQKEEIAREIASQNEVQYDTDFLFDMTIGTIILLACNKNVAPKYFMYAELYLLSIKDDYGRRPHNINNLLKYMKFIKRKKKEQNWGEMSHLDPPDNVIVTKIGTTDMNSKNRIKTIDKSLNKSKTKEEYLDNNSTPITSEMFLEDLWREKTNGDHFTSTPKMLKSGNTYKSIRENTIKSKRDASTNVEYLNENTLISNDKITSEEGRLIETQSTPEIPDPNYSQKSRHTYDSSKEYNTSKSSRGKGERFTQIRSTPKTSDENYLQKSRHAYDTSKEYSLKSSRGSPKNVERLNLSSTPVPGSTKKSEKGNFTQNKSIPKTSDNNESQKISKIEKSKKENTTESSRNDGENVEYFDNLTPVTSSTLIREGVLAQVQSTRKIRDTDYSKKSRHAYDTSKEHSSKSGRGSSKDVERLNRSSTPISCSTKKSEKGNFTQNQSTPKISGDDCSRRSYQPYNNYDTYNVQHTPLNRTGFRNVVKRLNYSSTTDEKVNFTQNQSIQTLDENELQRTYESSRNDVEYFDNLTPVTSSMFMGTQQIQSTPKTPDPDYSKKSCHTYDTIKECSSRNITGRTSDSGAEHLDYNLRKIPDSTNNGGKGNFTQNQITQTSDENDLHRS